MKSQNKGEAVFLSVFWNLISDLILFLESKSGLGLFLDVFEF
jgi:hypothetical protein